MSRPKIPLKSRNRWLVVEGIDDQYVTIELLGRHGAFWGDADREATSDLPYVENAGGLPKLRDTVAVQAKSLERRRLGMIFDADLDEGKAWRETRKQLQAIDTPPAWLSPMLAALPEVLPKEGLVIEHGDRALGAWVMPDNGASGALEAFLADLVPPSDIHWKYALESVGAAVTRGVAFKPQYRTKAEIHTWLAWQEDPGLPFGSAVKRKMFLHDTALALAFVAWFRRMFPQDG